MKIISFRAENIKRIEVVAITPAGNVVEITGKNGSGKTSVLDAIWWAIKGEKPIQETPIRKGSETAMIELDFGKLKVTRRFKAKEGSHTTSLIVETESDGIKSKAQNPQKVLDQLYSHLTFDPLEFTRMDAKKQFDTLKQFVPDVDFEEIDKANAKDFADRTDINRQADQLRAQIAGIQIADLVNAVRSDESALVAELAGAGEFNADLERRRARRATTEAEAERLFKSVATARHRAAALRAEADAIDAIADGEAEQEAALRKVITEAEALPPPRDTTEIQAKITAARSHNAQVDEAVRAKQSLDTMTEQAKALEAKSHALTEAMKVRTQAKQDAIAAAKLPVEGISFGDGAILLNDVPFDQASDAEQLRTSIAIAAAMNPKLRIIRVRDGSLLDEDSMKLLAEMAEKSDMQVWIETVSSDRPGAIVLEDGHVKASKDD